MDTRKSWIRRLRAPLWLLWLGSIGGLTAAPPSVNFLGPGAGTNYEIGNQITLFVQAEDPDGNETVKSVEIFNFGDSIGFAGLVDRDNGVWRFNFVASEPGVYSLTAVAEDFDGNTGTSAPLLLNVLTGFSPRVTLLSPLDSEVYPVGRTIDLSAEVIGTNRPVRVEFYVNGLQVGLAEEFPYKTEYTLTNEDPFAEIVVVAIEEGFGTAMDQVNITVTANQPPEISIIPIVNAFTLGSTIPVVADAGDIDGQVVQVDFFANNVLIGSRSIDELPFAVDWRPTVAGTYLLKAVATDDTGKRAEDETTVVVNPRTGQPPIGSLYITPRAPAYAIGSEIFLSADASDPDGVVERVTFLVNGRVVGSSTEEPYNVRYSFRLDDVSFAVEASNPNQLFSNVTLLVEDNDGNLAVVTTPIMIAPLDRRLPKHDLVTPEAGSIFGLGSAIGVEARLRAIDVDVEAIHFYENQQLIGIAENAPYRINRLPTTAGPVTYEAIAYYLADVTYVFPGDNPLRVDVPTLVSDLTDHPVEITLSAAGPFVELLNPAVGDLMRINQTRRLSARALSSAGGALEVQFFVSQGGTLSPIGDPLTEPPYAVDYTPVTTGHRQLFARVTETGVGVTDSNRAEIQVVLDTTPEVALLSPEAGDSFVMGSTVPLLAEAIGTGSGLTVEFFANGFLIGSDDSFPFTIDWRPNSTGRFFLTSRVTQEGVGSSTGPAVEVEVRPNLPPSVELLPPLERVIAGAEVTLSARATDPDGVVTDVEFFANDVLVGRADGEPFSVVWKPASEGVFRLRAAARDDSGNRAVSASLEIEVEAAQGPQVSLRLPGVDESVRAGSPVTLLAEIVPGDAAVTRVEFFLNGVLLGSTQSMPFSLDTVLPQAGTYRLEAVAVDERGSRSASPIHEITVLARVGRPPSVFMSHPVAATGDGGVPRFSEASRLFLNATALDVDGEVVSVSFQVNGEPLEAAASRFGDRFGVRWEPSSRGNFQIRATAVDNDGNRATSEPLVLEIGPLQAPLPTLQLEPLALNAGSHFAGEPLSLVAVRPAGSPPVDRVEFFADGVWIGTAISVSDAEVEEAFAFEWRPPQPGTFVLRAAAVSERPSGHDFSNIALSNSRQLVVAAASEERRFLLQTYRDLLNRVPEPTKLNRWETELQGETRSREEIVLEILEEPAFRIFREALMAWFVMTGEFPDRRGLLASAGVIRADREALEAEVESGPVPPGSVAVIPASGVSGVESLLATLEERFVEAFDDPFLLSDDAFLSLIFTNKYGVPPTAQQRVRLSFLLRERADDRWRMTAELILDNILDGTPALPFTRNLVISNPPVNRLPSFADTAALFLQLLRSQPSTEEVSALAALSGVERVRAILEDPRYAARFGDDFVEAQHIGAGWMRLSWFGLYNRIAEPWLYHRHLGWIYREPDEPVRGTWLYLPGLGWTWTHSESYPYLHRAETQSWYYYHPGSAQPRWFYDFRNEEWVPLER